MRLVAIVAFDRCKIDLVRVDLSCEPCTILSDGEKKALSVDASHVS